MTTDAFTWVVFVRALENKSKSYKIDQTFRTDTNNRHYDSVVSDLS